MEHTLGKRIAEQRKRLGLTQDQLAEKLGVTAQAVSKWENEQSCPDISILPRLADIFGISVDALLGREEAVPPVSDKDADSGEEGNSWEFSYKSGRKAGILLALYILAVGAQLLTGKLLPRQLNIWTLLWTTALVVWGSFGIYPKFSFFRVGCLLVGGYAALDHWQVLPGKLGSELIIPICLILLGISIFVDAMKKKNKSHWHFSHKGKKEKYEHFELGKDSFSYHSKFHDGHQYISLPVMAYGAVHTNFGDCTVDLTGVATLAPNCTLEARTNFGDLTLFVPKRFTILPNTSSNFGDINIEGTPDPKPEGQLLLDARAGFGDVTVRYV